ncbi:hypothetical protein Poly59_37770 [Rubripirellula reticaptiva]|uniref:Uncharacterized protein n=1 Tax=Rubripirellula reticaptiva TaxID=2528013 RepID=A0A5C6EH64_9BACT|nr:hypothetical protein Poly59_37770 [Rubripirellula reticaptiva]
MKRGAQSTNRAHKNKLANEAGNKASQPQTHRESYFAWLMMIACSNQREDVHHDSNSDSQNHSGTASPNASHCVTQPTASPELPALFPTIVYEQSRRWKSNRGLGGLTASAVPKQRHGWTRRLQQLRPPLRLLRDFRDQDGSATLGALPASACHFLGNAKRGVTVASDLHHRQSSQFSLHPHQSKTEP